MFIYNIQLSGSKIFKVFAIIVAILVIILFVFGTYKIFNSAFSVKDNSNNSDVYEITEDNYTSILKDSHDNLDSYIGKKFKISGYIYRVYDFDSSQFVIARNMVISSDLQTVVVGFLCKCHNANSFENGTWVEVTGEVTKGNYHGDIPELNISEINLCEKPSNEYVYPPDDSYISTSYLE